MIVKNLLKQVFPVLLVILTVSSYGQILSESFDNPSFPPAGWRNANINTPSTSTSIWSYATTSAETTPVTPPRSGAGMALYDAYNFAAGDSAELVTPALNFSSGNTIRVSFWMYRDSRYATLNDSVEIYVNTTPTAIGGTRLGVVYRHYLDFPAQATTGWYQYTYTVPASFNGSTNYIAFLAVSDFGTEVLLDDVMVSQISGCSGTPAAGTITGPSPVCSGTNFTLTNTGATNATGMRYAWQSAPAATGPWTNIPGQTDPNSATVSQTASTSYRFVDTCSTSNQSAISNVLTINLKPTVECYCQPPGNILHSFVNDYITNVSITGTSLNSSNATNPTTGYTQVPPTPESNSADLLQATSYILNTTLSTTPSTPSQVAAWIDFNANGNYESTEYFPLTISGSTASGSFFVPANATAGITGLRIRARAASFTSSAACTSFASGETEDYLVNIQANSATNGALVGIVPPGSSCNASNTVQVKLRNSGSVVIAAGAATVALYVRGANPQGPLTRSNTAAINPGDTVILSYTCTFTNAGQNIDSAFIQSLAGDVNRLDDSLVTSHFTLPPAVNTPFAEDFEGQVPGWLVRQIAGSGNWGLASSVSYPDYSPAITLNPKSGNYVALFDSYNFSSGTLSSLSSNCINIPANANSGCGYVVGFYVTQDAQYTTLRDSIVVKATSDGGNSYTRLGVANRVDSSLTTSNTFTATSGVPVWKLYTFDVGQFAGQTIQFALDAYSRFGNRIAIDSFFVGPKTVAGNVELAGGQENGLSLTPALTACTDANGWTYYSDGNSARYLFGIQWDPSNTGANAAARTQATARINIDRKWFGAENTAQRMATYTMQRYWNVNLNGATLQSPVNVRFFYPRREFDSIIDIKNKFIIANPGATDEGFKWFKTSSGAFQPSAASVNFDSVVNDVELIDVNTSGATINGVLYAQFNGVTNISGGTAASGVGPTTPLPVGLLAFNAQRAGRVNRITWTTAQEVNTLNFTVERSSDSRNFTSIGAVAAAGNSANNINYSFIDYTPALGINFYRLRAVDNSGQVRYSPVRNVRNEGTADIALYPNPANDRLLVNINSDRNDQATVVITDLNGSTIFTRKMSITQGMNYLPVQTAALAAGTYVIRVLLSNDMIVRKFSKL